LVAALAAAVLAALGPRLLHLGFLAHLKILSEGVFEYFGGPKTLPRGNSKIFPLHSYGGVEDIFSDDSPRIGVGPLRFG